MNKLVKIMQRATVTNYKNENRVELMQTHINPDNILYCMEFRDVVRVCFGQGDYIEVDKTEFEKVFYWMEAR